MHIVPKGVSTPHANFYRTKRAAQQRAALDALMYQNLKQKAVRCHRWDCGLNNYVNGWCLVLVTS